MSDVNDFKGILERLRNQISIMFSVSTVLPTMHTGP